MIFLLPFCTSGCPNVRALQQLPDLEVEVERLVRSRGLEPRSTKVPQTLDFWTAHQRLLYPLFVLRANSAHIFFRATHRALTLSRTGAAQFAVRLLKNTTRVRRDFIPARNSISPLWRCVSEFSGRPFRHFLMMSALPPKADMCGATRDVCFGPKADIRRRCCDVR